jgi:hypothetical protein
MSDGLHKRVQVSAEDLDEGAARSCTACGNAQPRKSLTRVQQSPDVDYLECGRCGACSVSAFPRPSFLTSFYEQHYAGPHVDMTATYARGLGEHIARALTLPAGHGTYRILDFGGSDGSLGVEVARSLLRSGQIERASIVVVDFVAPTRVDDERISIRAASQLSDVHETFDLVMASAVLEHIPDLKPTMKALFERMSPDGWFYARTPYVLPMRRILPRFDLMFPAHVHDLGPTFWNNVCRTFELNAEVVASRPSYVQGSLRHNPVQTIAATLLKLPAHLELRLGAFVGKQQKLRTPHWRLVGGWEIVLRRLDA